MDLYLDGKVALVTGAGSQKGMGKAIALTLAKEGCDVIVSDINFEDVKITAAAVEALGRKCLAIKTDVTKNDEVQDMFKRAVQKFGKIDILVNNAGAAFPSGPFLQQKEEDWDKNINLNLKAAMFCAQAVLPGMLERKYGKIVIISSAGPKLAGPAPSMYTLAKGALYMFTRDLAKMVAGSGIIVNSVAPGLVMSNFHKGDRELIIKRSLPGIPLGRPIETQEIANAVAFLTSDISTAIIGQVIFVDGGSTM
jgi:3-oxoacyl-[acyl-carrier protein] reductase